MLKYLLTMRTDIPAEKAAKILNQLKDKANKILSAAHNVKLDTYHVQSAGHFPHIFEDSSDLLFNEKTYKWLNKCLEKRKAGGPVTIEGDYNGKYLRVFTKINYNLSTEDQVKLNKANQDAEEQQRALLKKWRDTKQKLPADKNPIDGVIEVVRTEWATKKETTLMQMQKARDLHRLLGNAPASGQPVIPILANYLRAIGSAISIINDKSLNDGILGDVRDAINLPSEINGGIRLNDGTKDFHPAYAVSTPQDNVLEGLI